MNDKRLLHDFTNSCLRIEIINKLILEAIHESRKPNKDHFIDLQEGLQIHSNLVKEVQKLYQSH